MSTSILKTLPEGWRNIRLKWLLETIESGRREVSDTDSFEGGVLSVGGEHIGWQGEWLLDNPRFVSREFFEGMSSGKIRKNDVLLVKDGATIGKVAIATKLPADESAVNEHVFLLRFLEQNCPKYYFYFMQSALAQDQIRLEVRGSAQPGLNSDFEDVLLAPQPSLGLQRAIASYLDSEIARLDGLISAKEKWLDLLLEKRWAIIANSVMHGINSNVEMKDSKISWIGKVPAHWSVERTRWLFRERDQRSVTGEEEMLTVSHLTGVTRRSEKDVNMFEAETNEGYKLCCAGDLVINTLWAWMGAMGVAPLNGIVSPAYNVYTPSEKLAPAFVDALVRIPIFAKEVTRYSKGVWSSRLRLYPEGFFEVYFAVPPIEEQHDIVAHILQETAKIDALRDATEKTISLLKERRMSLITEVVTGSIKVA